MHYELEKNRWTEDDYTQMGWHDNFVHKIVMQKDLLLDIDYILKWNSPEIEGMGFTFWISPATLCFRHIKDLRLEMDMLFDGPLEIQDINRLETSEGIRWTIMMQTGTISFLSKGYTQFIRQQPTFQYRQFISVQERGGLSVELTTAQPNSYLYSQQYKEDRGRATDQYNHAKDCHQYGLSLKTLHEKRETGQISTKEYLIQKRELSNLIKEYQLLLKGTMFEM
ncbi:MAG: hypothetical protein ABW007_24505 [Chitinophagaceae bacterium]